MIETDIDCVKKAMVYRPKDANKGTFGSLLSICGCYGMAGAAIMAGKAALRCGIGLLKCALPKSIYPIAAASIFESVYFPLNETDDGKICGDNAEFLLCQAEKSAAVLIGCGLGVCEDTKRIVTEFLKKCTKPMLLDADALNCIAENPEVLKTAKSPVVITPHPGEMARLIGSTPKEINAERQKTAQNFAKEYRVITVLKGAGTVIASPDGACRINPTGNPGMATGGSGDVLSGMISSLIAQGAAPFDAACAGVYLHGLAGDIASEKFGEVSMLPTDIIDCVSAAFANCKL